jgi:hypothetical protein
LAPSLVALVRALALLDGVLRGLDPARDLIADLRRELVLSVARKVRRTFARLASPFRTFFKHARRLWIGLPNHRIHVRDR